MKRLIYNHPFKVILTLFLLMIASLDNIVIAEIFRQIYEVIETGKVERLIPILLTMTIAYGVISLTKFTSSFLQAKLIELYNIDTRNRLYQSFFKSGKINDQDTGNFISLMTNDYKHFESNYLKNVFRMIQLSFYVVLSIVYAFSLDLRMALIFLLFSTISAFVPKIFQKRIQSTSDKWTKNNATYTNILKENSLGKNTIIGYGVEDIFADKVKTINEKMESSLRKMSVWVAFSNSSVGYIATICFLLPEFIGVYNVVKGTLSLGVLLALMQVSNTIVGPFLSMLTSYNSIQSAKPIITRIQKQLRARRPISVNTLDDPIDEICFNNVTIAYGNQKILENITFKIQSGEKVLVIGESGSGKSSLLNSITGSAQVIDGTFTINQLIRQDIDNRSVLQRLSVVQQNVFLFDDTLAENITLGEHFSESEILSACQDAGLADLVKEKGLSFRVGENGENLSGGQQQRIEIARALIRKREVLLIDEATSALDKETANAIRSTYLNMPQTIIEVTHYIDPKFLEDYDTIIVLKQGEIVESGRASDLMGNKDTYLKSILLESRNLDTSLKKVSG